MVNLKPFIGPAGLVALAGIAGYIYYSRVLNKSGDASADIATVVNNNGGSSLDTDKAAGALYTQPDGSTNATNTLPDTGQTTATPTLPQPVNTPSTTYTPPAGVNTGPNFGGATGTGYTTSGYIKPSSGYSTGGTLTAPPASKGAL